MDRVAGDHLVTCLALAHQKCPRLTLYRGALQHISDSIDVLQLTPSKFQGFVGKSDCYWSPVKPDWQTNCPELTESGDMTSQRSSGQQITVTKLLIGA